MTAQEIESLCRGFLLNAAARAWAASQAEPETTSAEYLTGFGAGFEAGEVAALSLVVSFLSGQSATELIEEARSQAAVDSAFPIEVHIEAAEPEAA